MGLIKPKTVGPFDQALAVGNHQVLGRFYWIDQGYPDRSFDDAEPSMRADWEAERGGSALSWNSARNASLATSSGTYSGSDEGQFRSKVSSGGKTRANESATFRTKKRRRSVNPPVSAAIKQTFFGTNLDQRGLKSSTIFNRSRYASH